MADPSVQMLLTALQDQYGERILPYGGDFHEGAHGIGFRLDGVAATFSAITLDGSLPFGRFDVQIESYPPGEYVWADEYELSEFLRVVANVARGVWPDDKAG